MKYQKGLDTLRAFAVIAVLYWHFVGRNDLNSAAGITEQLFLPTGVFGVTLFFVLSGFLISSILLKAIAESDNKILIIRNFIIRRALRIFPVYYLLLIVLICLGYPFHPGELLSLFTYTSNFYMFKNMAWSSLGHTWSLAVEEQFYLIWPWLIVFAGKKTVKYIILSFIAVGMISSLLVAHYFTAGFDSPATVLTTSCFDAFGIGAFYAYLLHKNVDAKKISQSMLVLFVVSLAITFYWKLCPYTQQFPHFGYLNRTVNSILSLCIIHFTLNNRSLVLKKYFFENSFLNLIGKVSYGMYLYHWPLSFYLQKLIDHLKLTHPSSELFRNEYFGFAVKSVVTFIVSYLSFILIEKKFLRLKSLFEYKGKLPEK